MPRLRQNDRERAMGMVQAGMTHQAVADHFNVHHRQNPPDTLQKLRDALVQEWNNIPQAFIQRLISSMRRRCEAVVAARGGHTRY